MKKCKLFGKRTQKYEDRFFKGLDSIGNQAFVIKHY